MKARLSYIIFAVCTSILMSCSEVMTLPEDELLGKEKVSFSANSSRLITKSGLKYTYFDAYTKYLLFGVESGDSYDWTNAVMYDRQGNETEDHFIEYGKDLFFNGRELDFYGATLCSTKAYPENLGSSETNSSLGSPVIDLALENYGGAFPDLMYSRNLKNCTARMGVLEMNFTHALSKVQIEVAKQDDSEGLAESRIKGLSIVNSSSGGELDILTGVWSVDDTSTEIGFFNGNFPVTTDPSMITDENGNNAELLIIPNETSKQVLSLKIVVSTAKSGEKTIVYPLYTNPEVDEQTSERPFIFEQNTRYLLSIILLNDGVRVIAVAPQAFDWIDVPLEPYMGQPVNFGGLMWMDRNLGATSADCENDWANTRGFYYQFGRNIPYIFDHEKYLNRNKSVKNEFRVQEGKTSQLDIGYEYFFTYNDRGERVYGAVQGGTLAWHYSYHVSELSINGQKVGWVNNGSGWEWKGSQLTNYRLVQTPHYGSPNGNFNNGTFWNVDQVGYNGISSSTGWTESNGAPQWRDLDVTSSNLAINPGDPGIYHLVFDARYYNDFLQSGAWCVHDCFDNKWDHWRPWTIDEWNSKYPYWKSNSGIPTYKEWLLTQGCVDTRTEDTEKVNYYWADRDGTPLPDNHPCPKGWRIPTKEDYAGIVPDHNIDNTWANTTNRMFIVKETYGDVLTQYKEAVIYGVDHLGRKVIYVIKRKGEEECYRLRLLWKDSNLTRNQYYGLQTATTDAPMQYLEISRYAGSSNMTFDKYYNSSLGQLTVTNPTGTGAIDGVNITKDVRIMTGVELQSLGFYNDFDWESSTEVMQIPICGFIYTTMGVDGMFGDGDMTILRCTDWSENYDVARKVRPVEEGGLGQSYTEGQYPYNEAMNWCCYVRTDRNTGLFSGSRKCLGDQIRCVRDVTAQ